MRKFLISAAMLATAAAVAMPATGQDRYGYGNGDGYGHGNGNGNGNGRFDNRIERLADRIDRSQQRGLISRRTAQILNNEVSRLAHLERRYSHNGYTSHERYWINQRFASINQRLADASQRGDRYGYNDRDDRNDRDGRYAGNRQDQRGWDDDND